MNGYHLICDGILREKIGSEKILEILKKASQLAEMKIIGGPYVVEGEEHNPGWTGVCIIDFSHIALHTFNNNMTFSFDLYSCKEFDKEVIINYIKDIQEFDNFSEKFFRREIE